jgi:hypothetical protein
VNLAAAILHHAARRTKASGASDQPIDAAGLRHVRSASVAGVRHLPGFTRSRRERWIVTICRQGRTDRAVRPSTQLSCGGVRFDPKPVVHGTSELLLAPQVAFRRLDGHVAQEKLDLLEFAAGKVTQPGVCPTKIVGCQVLDARATGSTSGSLESAARPRCSGSECKRSTLATTVRKREESVTDSAQTSTWNR